MKSLCNKAVFKINKTLEESSLFHYDKNDDN